MMSCWQPARDARARVGTMTGSNLAVSGKAAWFGPVRPAPARTCRRSRYFSSRAQLPQALSATARDAAATRLAEADLDAVRVPEAIARVARVVAAGGSK